MTIKDRQAREFWEQFRKQLVRETTVNLDETATERKRRVEKLEKNFEAWAKYYFPNYYKSEPAPFHVRESKRWVSNGRIYVVRAWSRELAKSTRAMMEDLFLLLTGHARVKLLVSNSEANAVKLATPYRINLESNQRIINDYGEQKSVGDWSENKFTTKTGFVIAALGARQSPRGFKLEEFRPDIIDVDDIDTDEECRNSEIIKKKWDWIEQALIPTVSISGNKRIRFNGNIIAKYCCITEAIKMADHVDIINIRDKKGKSTWPQKNSEKDIDWILSKISYFSKQKEYYNNPITRGTVFEEMHYKKMPPLSRYPLLVCYMDLSYKSSKKNDYKFAVLMGKQKNEYHILKAFGVQGTTLTFAKGLVGIEKFVDGKTPVYWVAEENFLQDTIKAQLHENLTKLKSGIAITGDTRKKPDKFYRIESTLEPLNSNGRLFLNERQKDDPSMKILEEQFLAIAPSLPGHDDGPDAAEGGKNIIDTKVVQTTPGKWGRRRPNNKRF